MDYENLIKKFESKTRIEKPAKYKAPEEPLDVNNFNYNAKIKQLLDAHNKINIITGTDDPAPEILIDRMRLTVLAKDFEKVENRPETFFEMALNTAGFRAWCGRGTKLMANVAADQDFANSYAIDMICKNHDFNTHRAKTQQDIKNADIEMLKEISDNYFISNLFGTKQKITAMSSITDHLFNSIFSFDTATNLMKGHQILTLGQDILKYNPITLRKQYENYLQYSDAQRAFKESQPNFYRSNILFRQIQQEQKESYENLLSKAKWRLLGLGQRATFTTLFKDTLLAGLSFAAITLKLFYENIIIPDIAEMTGANLPPLTAPAITEFNMDDISDLLKQFQDLENLRLEKAGYEPINIIDVVGDVTIQQPIQQEPIPEPEPEPVPVPSTMDVNEDIFDITDIPFSVETETLDQLKSYIENLE